MARQMDLFEKKEATGEKSQFVLPDIHTKRISVDTETTGLLRFSDNPVGISVCDGVNSWYIPFGHKTGLNFDKSRVVEWCKYAFNDREILLFNAKFDIRMLRKIGVDLEELNCTVRDVQHAAIVVDPDIRDYSLNNLAQRYLNESKLEIDVKNIQDYSSEYVAPYAKKDAELTFALEATLDDEIDRLGLRAVLDLEDSIIFAVLHMEENGARINEDLLLQWSKDCQSRYVRNVLRIYDLVGFRVEPTKPTDLVKLFTHLQIPYELTEAGHPSFSKANMKSALTLEPVQLAFDAKNLFSMQSKFLSKYLECCRDGHIYYSLNQLRADEYGAITGRFSSSGGGRHFKGINIQQVFKSSNMEEAVRSFQIRQLFIPDDGYVWCSSDAKQIEFRIFAHYANSVRLLDSYREDPEIDFHTVVSLMIGQPRDKTKRINFGTLYGMGIAKLARELGMSEYSARKLFEQYHEKFPEAKRLLRQASDTAEKRGYVKTLLGRRRNYGEGSKTHSALNAVIQGTAADVMKIKIRDVYSQRKAIGLGKIRFTVHDELNCDIPDPQIATRLKEVLESPVLGLRVPILWDVKTGKNWGECK